MNPVYTRTEGRVHISSPNRILEGLLLALDRRDEFTSLDDGSCMVPSRTSKARHNTTADECSCPDSRLSGYRCAHRIAVAALEVVREECLGSFASFEHDLRVAAVLDLMVRIQKPMPSWATTRMREVRYEQMREEALSLVGVSGTLREMLAGACLARRDTAWAEGKVA